MENTISPKDNWNRCVNHNLNIVYELYVGEFLKGPLHTV